MFNQKPNSLDNSRKRPCTEQHSPCAKRQRVDCCSTDQQSPSFWDGLSKIWLTEDALREFDRRNRRNIRCIATSSPRQERPAQRPITRKFLTESRGHDQRRQTAVESIRDCTLEHLKAIKQFARRGGVDLSDLRGHPEPVHAHSFRSAMSPPPSGRRPQRSSRGSSSSRGGFRPISASTTATKNSRPKDANYQQKLIDGYVFPYGYHFPNGRKPPLPDGWDEFIQRLTQPRPSLSPSTFPEEEYQKFVEEDARALNEDAVKDTVVPAMLRAMGASDGAQKNVLFTNMDPLVPGISQAKPDYYYGSQPEQIHWQIRQDLSGYIVPSTSTHFPAVPNFFMEIKGPLGNNRETLLQACSVGAIGARAKHILENYQQDTPEYHGKVSSISCTYIGGNLKMYGHSIVGSDSSETQPHYYMHQLEGFCMASSKTAFLQGTTAFKNARDWAEESRNIAIAKANAIAAAWTEEGEEIGEGEAESTPTFQCFAFSTLGEDEDAEESATSEERDSRHPPAKRSSRWSAGSRRRKRNQAQ